MKVVKKKKVVSETLYQSNDGECFEYPILAKEHEINAQQKKVSPKENNNSYTIFGS